MDSYKIIAMNSASSPEFDEQSFIGQLHESGVWQKEQYWLVEWAIYDLIKKSGNHDDLHGSLFRIFSYVMGAISSHLDQCDMFEIENLEREEIYEFRERIQLVFEGFFEKRIPERAVFSEENPLLNGS